MNSEWSLDSKLFNLQIKAMKSKYFFLNILDNTQVVQLLSFAGQIGGYSVLHVNLFLRRRTLFYTFNFIIPGVFVTILSIIGFKLPAKSGEKIGFRKFKIKIKF